MDVIKERLEREYNLALITTAPNVIYEVVRTNGDVEMVDNPSLFPPQTVIDHVEEPFVNATIIVPKEYVGPVMELSQEKRGEYANMTYLDENRVMLHYSLPLSEIIFDYFDRLKSVSRGYASLDYELSGYRPSDMVKVDILLMGILSTRCRPLSIGTAPKYGAAPLWKNCARSFPGSFLKSPSRPQSEARSLLVRTSVP